jgi:hypothetical protein
LLVAVVLVGAGIEKLAACELFDSLVSKPIALALTIISLNDRALWLAIGWALADESCCRDLLH